MFPIIHLSEIVVGISVTGFGFLYLDRISRIPYGVYFISYIITCLVGGLIIFFSQDNASLWSMIFFKSQGSTLPSPLPERYFQLLLMPLLIIPITVIFLRWLFPAARQAGVVTVRSDGEEVSAIILVSGVALIFCVLDFVNHGISLIGYLSFAQTSLDYAGKMLIRINGLSNITILSTVIIYTALPMFVASLVASENSSLSNKENKRAKNSIAVMILMANFYFCTLVYIKGQIIISSIYLIISVILIKRIKMIYIIITSISGVLLLGVLYYFLSFAGGYLAGTVALRLAFLTAFYQIFFRMSVGLPFYASLFPDVQPHPGIFLGPGFLGLAPKFATNNVVFNYVARGADSAVQGQIPAPAHFSAYAGGGMLWAAVSLVLVAVVIFLVGRIGRNIHTALGVGMFVLWCIYLYYTTQTDLIGGLWASYGPAFGVFFYYICRGVQAVIRAARRQSLLEGQSGGDA